MPRGYVNGYPANAGGKVIVVGTMTGPASYTHPNGQPFTDSAARSIDFVDGSVTVSGSYRVIAQPASASQPHKWYFRWIVIASGAEAANLVDLSGETFTFFAVYS